jgi:serine/threonine-protein kinase
MKACPACGRLYPDDAGFCPVEGSALGSATQVPARDVGGNTRIGELVCSRYEIRRVVADGGMGRVFEALDLQERRSVALKILHPEIASDQVAVERFKREFAVSRELPHDYIVEVLDFRATSDATYTLVMEFLYGEELRATLKRERVLPPSRLLRMVSQVAIGLDAAHAKKLVHRDLKPDNLFLCQKSDGDIVKILDFGSVKDTAEDAKKLTMLGTTIGSPYYMAPEQAQGLDTLDHRADVWALAAIVYECSTGRLPFQGKNGPSILLQILTKEPEPASVAARGEKHPVPRALDFALSKAFKKSPAERTASVGAFADAVGHAYGLEGTHTDWARRHESELSAEIALRAAEPGARERDRSSVTSSFFNERGALGDSEPPASSHRFDVTDPAMPPIKRSIAPSLAPDFASEVPPASTAESRARRKNGRLVVGVAMAVCALLVLVAWVLR